MQFIANCYEDQSRRSPSTRRNYAQLISRLTVPESIYALLLYRDVWDTDDFEPYLIDGHGGNVPLGLPLNASRIEDDGEGGLLIGCRFIPDCPSNPAQVN
ncbi:unnamed protein product [Echinostoma caproni]|uniref:DDE_5 domain-containing protein n=1 Tax=Echinostoma caproni TaxID=27848 RepID=A0A183BD03_9TREM|nr:unnamed protein product [Echinostoma caproni]